MERLENQWFCHPNYVFLYSSESTRLDLSDDTKNSSGSCETESCRTRPDKMAKIKLFKRKFHTNFVIKKEIPIIFNVRTIFKILQKHILEVISSPEFIFQLKFALLPQINLYFLVIFWKNDLFSIKSLKMIKNDP